VSRVGLATRRCGRCVLAVNVDMHGHMAWRVNHNVGPADVMHKPTSGVLTSTTNLTANEGRREESGSGSGWSGEWVCISDCEHMSKKYVSERALVRTSPR
jgi:hypothetical protein